MMTSRMRAGIKFRQLAVENVMGIPHARQNSIVTQAVYNYWNGLVDWSGGLH